MFPVFRSLSLRYLRLRWERAALVVISIALGVATLVSTRILTQILESAAHDTETPIPIADLYVSNGEIGVSRDVADDIRAAHVPGVESTSPMIFEQVRLPGLGGPNGAPALLVAASQSDLGSSRGSGKSAFSLQIMNSRAALSGTGIFISQHFQQMRIAAGLPADAPVTVRFADREMTVPLAGVLLIDQEGKAASFERNLIAMELELALRLLSTKAPPEAGHLTGLLLPAAEAVRGDRVTRIDIHVVKGTDPRTLVEPLQKIVGDRATIKTIDDQKKSTDDAIAGIMTSFKLCSAGALIVGLFLVYNALAVSVAERRHDIGVLRALGATRFQIARLFAGEAALLGIAGAVLGIPLGTFLANTAVDLVAEDINAMFLNSDIRPQRLSWLTMLYAVLAGVATALLAALVPAIQAANDEPADAVRRAPGHRNRIFLFLHRFACIGLIGGGVLVVVFRENLPFKAGSTLGLSAVLVGMFLSLPILVAWLAQLMQPVIHWFFGIEARLAADNLIRSPARTGVVIGALAAGVSLMFQTAGVGRSNEEPITRWIDEVIRADAFVFSESLTSANSSLSPMNSAVASTIRNVDGVERVVGLRFVHPEFRGSMICLVAIDADDYQKGTRARLPEGKLPKLESFAELPKGNNIVVSDNFAAKFNMKEGDVVTLPRRRGGPIDLTIVGIGQDYTWNKGTLFMDRQRYIDLFDDDMVDIFHVYFNLGTDKKVAREAVEEVVTAKKLVVEDRAFVREFLAGVIDKVYRIAYLQQIIIAVVAALGVVTALLISVLQRRRELGLLRAVGATQLQVLRTVLAEAFLMGVIGTALGIAIGLPMEWYLLHVVIFEESGFWFDMIIPWKEALGIAVVAVGVATIAGLLPAIHAVRLRIVDAIAYE